MNRAPKATLIGAVLFSTITIWAVHFQQQQERDVGLRSDTHFHSSGLIYHFRRPCTEGYCETMSVGARNLGREKRTSVHLNTNESGMNRFKRSRKLQIFDASSREVSTTCPILSMNSIKQFKPLGIVGSMLLLLPHHPMICAEARSSGDPGIFFSGNFAHSFSSPHNPLQVTGKGFFVAVPKLRLSLPLSIFLAPKGFGL